MPDQHQRGAMILGEPHQLMRRRAHLADRPRRALDQVRMHRLDRIDHQQRGRLVLPERRENIPHRRRRRQPHRRPAQPKPKRAQPHLVRRLLARQIHDGFPRPRHVRRDLEQQGRFPDPRIAADQRRRPRHQPAPDRPVELGNPARQPRRQGDHDIEPNQLDRPPAPRQVMLLREHRRQRRRLLRDAVPLGAVGTLPLPARLIRPADGANIASLELGHPASLC